MRIRTVHTGQRSETIHRANLSAILRVLHEHGPRSRSELVAATGLTRSAIRDLVHELAAAGFVSEGDAVRLGTPGRPSPLVRPEPTGAVVLAFEVLVGSMAAAIVGLGGRTLDRIRVEGPLDDVSVDDVVDRLVRLAGDLRVPAMGPIVGVGVAVAGVVRRSDGLVFMAPNLGWVDVPFGARLARALGLDLPITVAQRRRCRDARRASPRAPPSTWTTPCTSRARSASAAARSWAASRSRGAPDWPARSGT